MDDASIFMLTFECLMEYSMYNTLLQLPLFQGMSKDELSEIIERVKFHFVKVNDKRPLFVQGEPCNKLAFLLGGTLLAETAAPCGTFTFVEVHDTPMMIEPQSLFGQCPCYKASYTAQGEVALLTIDKQYIYDVLSSYEIFRINFFNQLSYREEQIYRRVWSIEPQSLEGRLAYFIRSLCSTPQGTKILRIKMEDLAQLMDDTRLNISNILNKWQREGRIEMRRKEFVIYKSCELVS